MLINAILLAGLYAIMSYGLALIYGVQKLINLAHAGVIMLAAYAAYTLNQALGLDPILTAVPVMVIFFLLGMVLHWLLIRRIPESAGPAVSSLLLLFGVWLVMQNFAYWVWQGDDRSIMTGYTFSSVHPLGVTVPVPRLLVFVIAVVALLLLSLVVNRTYLGKAIRAVSQNRSAALLSGVNAQRIAMISFGLGIALAALGGNLATMIYSFNPDFGRGFLLKAFCIIVLGGMESFVGVALGAFVLAIVETYSVLFIPARFQDVIAFSLLVIVLVIMPTGLVGLFERKGVAR